MENENNASNLNELPYLMSDEKEDGPAEGVMTYIISWTLRMAACAKIESERPVLFNECRKILCGLLGLPINDNIIFKDVKTWKEVKSRYHTGRIDLVVFIDSCIQGINTKYALLFELKYFGPLLMNQLMQYNGFFEYEKGEERQDEIFKVLKDVDKGNRKKILLTVVDDKDDPNKFENQYRKQTNENNFALISLHRFVKGLNLVETESDIFNEFWIRWLRNYVYKEDRC